MQGHRKRKKTHKIYGQQLRQFTLIGIFDMVIFLNQQKTDNCTKTVLKKIITKHKKNIIGITPHNDILLEQYNMQKYNMQKHTLHHRLLSYLRNREKTKKPTKKHYTQRMLIPGGGCCNGIHLSS